MTDGYGAYEALAKKSGAFAVAYCWAHVRRKFVEAEPFFAEAKTAVDVGGESEHGQGGSRARAVAADERATSTRHSRPVTTRR